MTLAGRRPVGFGPSGPNSASSRVKDRGEAVCNRFPLSSDARRNSTILKLVNRLASANGFTYIGPVYSKKPHSNSTRNGSSLENWETTCKLL